jgi:ArsR family transcriptional regulator
LAAVRAERADRAEAYFERNAPRWDQLRSLYVSETDVEAAILAAADGHFARLIDLGTGAGRMLTLLAPRAETALGLDLSHQMLNIARLRVAEAGLRQVELRHGDIFATGLPAASADLVVVHQVLHYLGDPAAAVAEAARLVAPGGRLLIVDFAPHKLEYLREAHQHRRLGFPEEEMARWLAAAGLKRPRVTTLLAGSAEGLTVKIWAADRKGEPAARAA